MQFQIGHKLKCGLAPTGVFRQLLGTTQQFQISIYARVEQKTNERKKA